MAFRTISGLKTGQRRPFGTYAKGNRPRDRRRRVAKVGKAVKQAISNALTRKMETKEVHFYGGPAVTSATGTYASRTVTGQNGFISNFNTDFKRLLPFVVEGTGDQQRVGDQLRPVSLKVNMTLSINYLSALSALRHVDIYAVLYVLEHKNITNYVNLFPGTSTLGSIPTGLDFTTLLDNGENTTVGFSGEYIQSRLPVSNYFKLLKKKIIRLRYAGAQLAGTDPAPTVAEFVSVANCHDYRRELSFTIKCPKVLKYPQNLTAPGSTAIPAPNDPQNFAPFMCVGFYNADGTALTPITPNPPGPDSFLQLQYHTVLRYKDA